jgi:hypothetical protein
VEKQARQSDLAIVGKYLPIGGYFFVTVQGVIKKMSYMELDGITMNKQL